MFWQMGGRLGASAEAVRIKKYIYIKKNKTKQKKHSRTARSGSGSGSRGDMQILEIANSGDCKIAMDDAIGSEIAKK